MAQQSQYCSLLQFQAYGMLPARAGEFTDDMITANLQAASSEADVSLTSQYVLPILESDANLAKMVACIAAYNLYTLKGFNPNASVDKVIKDRNDEAKQFFKDIREELIHPDYTDSAGTTASTPAAGVFVVSVTPVGWTDDTDNGCDVFWNWWK